MDVDALYQVKKWIFFLPVLIAVVVGWQCRKRGARFSRWLVYVLPFLLPVIFCIINIKMDINLISPLLGKELALTFIAPYWWSVLTSGALILLKSISAFVRAGIDTLSFPELFCLHAGAFVLGFVFSIILMIGASPDVGMF